MNVSGPKRLLVVFHSATGGAARLADAVVAGARAADDGAYAIEILQQRAFDTNAADVLAAHGLIFVTPENFGYMSGALKDFFDRVFYPCETQLAGRPYALVVNAGNDGAGAVSAVERIVTGWRLKRVADPVIARKGITAHDLERCEELGATFATGLALGVL
jgi:multimeric flavodoxin WrbA